MAAEKVIVYRSVMEQRQDEYWTKFLDMNPWIAVGFMYLCVAAIVWVLGYTLWSTFRSWRR